ALPDEGAHDLGAFEGKRVLVVEAREASREALSAQLRAWRITAVGVATLPEALSALPRGTFDAAIVDLELGDGNAAAEIERACEELALAGLLPFGGRRSPEQESIVDAALSSPV